MSWQTCTFFKCSLFLKQKNQIVDEAWRIILSDNDQLDQLDDWEYHRRFCIYFLATLLCKCMFSWQTNRNVIIVWIIPVQEGFTKRKRDSSSLVEKHCLRCEPALSDVVSSVSVSLQTLWVVVRPTAGWC